MQTINGKTYPMWSQFVEKKANFIGNKMFDVDSMMGAAPETEVVDVELVPNGTDSAMICFRGKDYDCISDVKYCGISSDPQQPNYMVIATQFGNTFYIEGQKRN